MSRFDSVAYDKDSNYISSLIKDKCLDLEKLYLDGLPEGRERSIALTKLEESFMWVGKALRVRTLQKAQNEP